MNSGRLILTPEDPYAIADREQLISLLGAMEIMGAPLEKRKNAFAGGEALMKWISFAGCSPFLRFEPEGPNDDDFCHLRITIHTTDEPPVFLYGEQTKPPACPHCRQPLKEWPPMVEQWRQSEAKWECSGCGKRVAAPEMNWRRYAGFAKTLVEIFSIFPGEAVPVPSLLGRLAEETGVKWHYFYVK